MCFQVIFYAVIIRISIEVIGSVITIGIFSTFYRIRDAIIIGIAIESVRNAIAVGVAVAIHAFERIVHTVTIVISATDYIDIKRVINAVFVRINAADLSFHTIRNTVIV